MTRGMQLQASNDNMLHELFCSGGGIVRIATYKRGAKRRLGADPFGTTAPDSQSRRFTDFGGIQRARSATAPAFGRASRPVQSDD